MKASTYLNSFSNTVRENKLLKLGFLLLLVITLLNWSEVRNVRDQEKVVLIPIGASGTLWVTSDSASDDYVLFMTRYILHQFGDYTIHTISEQLEELNRHFSPETFVEANERFKNIVKGISKYPSLASTLSFNNKDVLHDAVKKRIKVKATKIRYMSGVKTGEDVKNYVISYEIKNARFWIKNIMEEK